MAYTATDKILVSHYNTFVAGAGTFGSFNHSIANINTVWGEGFADKGYGQTSTLTQANIGSVVSATQWATLITKIIASANHQVTSIGTMPGDGNRVGTPDADDGNSLTTGDLIYALNNIGQNVTDIFTNRLNSIATASTSVENASGSSAWPASSIHTINVKFTSADAARYFFNAGGNIAITMSRSGGASNGKNDSWDKGDGTGVLPESGTVALRAHSTTKSGGSGATPADYTIEPAIGYYELGPAPIQIFQQFVIGGGVYVANNAKIEVSTNGTQGDAGDVGDLITFLVTLTDDAGDPPSVDGTTTVTATVNFPATTYLSEASWSTVTFVPSSGVVQT